MAIFSDLCSVIKESDARSDRTHAIDTITIHCAAGQVNTESCLEMFADVNRQVSSNYVIGRDGRIGGCVPEEYRAWTTGGYDDRGRQNDFRAITIEVASDASEPCAVNDCAYQALIKLVADIAKRNPGIGTLKWSGNKNLIGQVDKQNMTVHRWFANKSCPGEFLYSRMGEIAAKANELNKVGEVKADEIAEPVESTKPTGGILYKVQLGAFLNKDNAVKLLEELKGKGYDCIIAEINTVQASGSKVTKSVSEVAREVLIGEWGNGEERRNRLSAAGYDPDEIQREVNKFC